MKPLNVLIEFDKRQAEWVVVAYIGRDARMIEVIENNLDPHTRTAHLITGVPEDLIKKEAKIVGHHTDPEIIKRLRQEQVPELFEDSSWILLRTMALRQGGKKSNHALNYDMGYLRFALENEVPNSESKRCCEAYQRAYPGVKAYQDFVKRCLYEDRTLIDCYGNKRRFLGRDEDKLYKDAYSFLPQSTVVTMVNRAMVRIYNSKARFLRPLEGRAQVHDSLTYQYPLRASVSGFFDLARTCLVIKAFMSPVIEYHAKEFRIETDMKLGTNAGNMIEVPFATSLRTMAINLQDAYQELMDGREGL